MEAVLFKKGTVVNIDTKVTYNNGGGLYH